MPPPISSAPTMKQSRSWVASGARPPRRTAMTASITTPAIRNLVEAIVNGGIDSTAIRIPRYVEPQTTYRMRIASQDEARGAGVVRCLLA